MRERGDSALLDWTFKIDKVQMTDWQVNKSEIETAGQRISFALYEALGMELDDTVL